MTRIRAFCYACFSSSRSTSRACRRPFGIHSAQPCPALPESVKPRPLLSLPISIISSYASHYHPIAEQYVLPMCIKLVSTSKRASLPRPL